MSFRLPMSFNSSAGPSPLEEGPAGNGPATYGSSPTTSVTRVATPMAGAAALAEDSGDVVDRVRDPTREGGEGDKHAERDHGQDDAVLGHRLTLLALEPSAEVIDPLRKR